MPSALAPEAAGGGMGSRLAAGSAAGSLSGPRLGTSGRAGAPRSASSAAAIAGIAVVGGADLGGADDLGVGSHGEMALEPSNPCAAVLCPWQACGSASEITRSGVTPPLGDHDRYRWVLGWLGRSRWPAGGLLGRVRAELAAAQRA